MLKRINQTARCFNRAHQSYDAHSHIQQYAGYLLSAAITKHGSHFSTIVDAGCGTGLITEQLGRLLTFNRFFAIDIANQLLMLARSRLSHTNMICLEADFDHWHAPVKPDLIFANLSLHWSKHLGLLIKFFHDQLNTNGILAFSLPLDGTLRELPAHYRHQFYTKEDVYHFFHQAHFHLLSDHNDQLMVQYENSLLALKSIKAVGATHLIDNSLTEATQHSLCSPLKKLLPTINNSLTYHLGFFVASKF